MDLSIIIVNYRTKGLLLDCIGAIYNHTPLPLNFEVIVVDNGSGDDSAEAVNTKFDRVKLIVNKDNLGLARAINKGLSVSGGKYILLLGPDIVFSSQIFTKMVEFMDMHPDVGAVAPLLLDSNRRIRPIYGRLATFLSHFSRSLGLRDLIPDSLAKKYRMKIDISCDFIPLDWLMCACLMLRHKAIKDVGQFDENFFFYFEDIELCQRLKDKGWKLYLIPKLSVIHIQHQGIKLLSQKTRKAIYRRSVLYFYYKHWFKKFLLKAETINI